MVILINASDVAAAIGKNKYKTVKEMIVKVWKKNHQSVYKRALALYEGKDEETEVEEIIQSSGCIAKLEAILQASDTDKKDLASVQGQIEVFAAENQLSDEKIKKVQKEVVSRINRKRGIDNEEIGLNRYQKKFKTTVTHRNQQKYYYQGKNYKIVGKIDGIEEDVLIEHKHRINRLFTWIPSYEQVQIQTYLKLANLQKGKLVQHFKGETKVQNIDFDPLAWMEIEAGLEAFSEKYSLILLDQEQQKHFIQNMNSKNPIKK